MRSMTDDMAFYARISMSEAACRAWLVSDAVRASDLDWPEPCSARSESASVEQVMDAAAERSPIFCCDHDDTMGAFVVADVVPRGRSAELYELAASIRGAAAFIDGDEPSYAVAFPALSGGDPAFLIELARGSSRFIDPAAASPDVLYFMNEAEEFIEALLEDDEEDGR